MKSLSEIETAVKRASRAVGYSWGNSEEVGKSIRQLELFGFQGIKNLNKYYKDKSTKKFEDLNFVYVGDGNNIASSLSLIAAKLGLNFIYSSPKKYQIPDQIFNKAKN